MTDQPPPVVHVVCNDEWEYNGPVALFTTPEVAEQHARDLRAEHRSGYVVLEFPLLDRVPVRADLHLRSGYVQREDGTLDDEQAWAVPHWDYEIPAEPVVSIDTRRPDRSRVHIAAATRESADAAFARAVEQIRGLADRGPETPCGDAS